MVVNRNLSKAVDDYFTETIVAPDPALEEALAANAAAGRRSTFRPRRASSSISWRG
jgi:hypothetical protein